MTAPTKNILHAAITLVVLAVLSWLVWQRETVLRSGHTVLLALAPVDPRSLMQGDYMILRYEIAVQHKPGVDSGAVVVELDDREMAKFVRFDNGTALAPRQQRVRFFGTRGGEMRLGAESFFFQEGHADRYAGAKFGELKVDAAGHSVLVGLRNAALERLGTTAAVAPQSN